MENACKDCKARSFMCHAKCVAHENFKADMKKRKEFLQESNRFFNRKRHRRIIKGDDFKIK